MGFRNPVTTAVDPTARDMANQALTQIIPGSRLAADSIDGKTITGSTIRTAVPGQPLLQMDSTNGLRSLDAAGNQIAALSPGGKLTAYAGASSLVVDAGLVWKSGQTGSTDGSLRDDVLTLNGVPTGRRVTCSPGSIAGYAGTSATVTAQTTASGSTIALTADQITLTGTVAGADTAWTAATYQNSWTTYAATNIYGPAQFRKLVSGLVVVTGLIAGGTISSTLPAFVLPVGYRPTERLSFPAQSNNAFGRVDVDTNGNVYVVAGSNVNVSVCLSFFAG